MRPNGSTEADEIDDDSNQVDENETDKYTNETDNNARRHAKHRIRIVKFNHELNKNDFAIAKFKINKRVNADVLPKSKRSNQIV